MTLYYGKRNPGALTAASPGDTLYIPLQFYNDSGASTSVGSTLAVTDIEVFKNGSITQRATDSGYAILGDTGNFDNRIGFKGISISLFNTADDASFYASGSTYWVAIDSVTVDARTVRFWAGVFEIGTPVANVTQIGGDTGAANYLKTTYAGGFHDTGLNQRFAQIQSDVDTGLRTHISDVDTGLHDTLSDYDTGLRGILSTTGVRVSDTGINFDLHYIKFETDTGIRSRVLQVAGFVDTGLHDTIADLDTGLRGILLTTGVNVTSLDSDTGAADRLSKFAGLQLKTDGTFDTGTGQTTNTFNITASASVDTGVVNNAVWNGARSAHTTAGSFGEYVNANLEAVGGDTGAADVDGTSGRLNVNASATVDTGVLSNTVWNTTRAAHTTTGTFGAYTNANLVAVLGDTGAADLVGGRLNVNASATVDTGVMSNVVWNSLIADHATAGTFGGHNAMDTGVSLRLSIIAADTDTGIQSSVNVTSLSDTGINSRFAQVTVTGFSDTGVNQRLAQIQSDVDTGLRAQLSDLDTGLHDTLSDYDTGVRGILLTTGVVAATINDTGINDDLHRIRADVDTGLRASVLLANVMQIRSDTGSAAHLGSAFLDGFADTGINQRLAQILSDVDTGLRAQISDVDTGLHDALADYDTGVRGILVTTGVNVTRVNSDTGAASQLQQAFATTPTYFQHVDVQRLDADTGAATHLQQTYANGFHDTGLNDHLTRIRFDVDTGLRAQIADVDTGIHSVLQTSGVLVSSFSDTGVNNRLAVILADTDTGIQGGVNVTTFADTGVNDRLGRIGFDVDTGLRAQIADLDTGLHDTLSDYDTGVRGILLTTGVRVSDTGFVLDIHVIKSDVDTGLRTSISDVDTGLHDALADVDTGLRAILQTTGVYVSSFGDTGVNNRLAVILADTDTGLRSYVLAKASDTGVTANVAAIKTKTDSLTFTKAGEVDSNIQSVNDVTVGGTGGGGDEWGPA